MEHPEQRVLARLLVDLLAGEGRDVVGAANRAIALRLSNLFLDGIDAINGIGGLDHRDDTEDSARLRLPSPLLDALRSAARREAFDDAVVTQEIDAVLAVLAGAGVRPVVLKGRALAVAVWPRPSQRPPGDLDLLLEPDALVVAERALVELGYRRAPGEAFAFCRPAPTGVELLPPPGGRLVVDLHAQLFRSVGGRIEAAALLGRSRATRLGACAIRVLDDADQLVFLLVHAAKHGLRALKWLLDLYLLARRTDEETWRRAIVRARAAGVGRPFYAAASVVALLPASRIDPRLLDGVRPPFVVRALLARLISLPLAVAGRAPERRERYLLEVALEPRLLARARLAAGACERLLREWMRNEIPPRRAPFP